MTFRHVQLGIPVKNVPHPSSHIRQVAFCVAAGEHANFLCRRWSYVIYKTSAVSHMSGDGCEILCQLSGLLLLLLRTSTASSRSQYSPRDPNSKFRSRVIPPGPRPQRIFEDKPDKMPERMSKDMPDTHARKDAR